jgi:hypothetical protein
MKEMDNQLSNCHIVLSSTIARLSNATKNSCQSCNCTPAMPSYHHLATCCMPPLRKRSITLPMGCFPMKRFLAFITWSGLIASLFGFSLAYWAISQYQPYAYHYFFTSLGLISAMYGFYQAFRTIRKGKVEVGNAPLALILTSAGLAATIYGFLQAYRRIFMAASGIGQIISIVLVTAGVGAAMYGFWRGYGVIIREFRR